MSSPRSRAPKVADTLFSASNHRWPVVPRASELGITSVRRAALIRIRVLYGRMADEMSYLNVREMEILLAEAEGLLSRHFASEYAALLAARQPIAFPDQQPSISAATESRALAS